MNSIPMRGPWQGAFQILQFNGRSYLLTASTVAVALIAMPFLPHPWRELVLVGVTPPLFWLVSSLIVAHAIYDRFPLYDLNWIPRKIAQMPSRWLNIHCGLDETSALLAATFPNATGEVVDIFDPRVMTEPSIRRARQIMCNTLTAKTTQYDSLPFAPRTFDTAFCFFAAHELRKDCQRTMLFLEVARVLVSDGVFVLMEHSRDWWNLLAFGPGFLHFYSKRAWRQTALDAGFEVRIELSMTPFVRVYIMRRNR